MQKYKEIGKRLKELRGSLSQKEFAAKIGVSFAAYQNYEYGKRMPHGLALAKIAEQCHVTTDYILTGVVDSLYQLLLEHNVSATALDKDLGHLNEKILQKIHQRTAAFKDADELLRLADLAGKHGFDICPLIDKYLSEKFSIENILTSIKEGQALLRLDLMEKIIDRVEMIFQTKELRLPPKKKARLIILLYDELKTSADKIISKELILKKYKDLKKPGERILK